jgi:hypothetical protein
MNEEFLKFIDLVAADGVISEKEKVVVYRKAQELGINQDEAEIIFEGRLHQLKKQSMSDTSSANNLDEKKCPNCNAIFESFVTNCSYCGFEITRLIAVTSVKELHHKLMELENQRVIDNNPFKAFGALMMRNLGGTQHDEVDLKKMELIRSFPIPNTKEDILEFFSLALPEATVKIRKFLGVTYQEDKTKEAIKKVWITKCEQIIIKAKFAMKEDPETQYLINQFAEQLKL